MFCFAFALINSTEDDEQKGARSKYGSINSFAAISYGDHRSRSFSDECLHSSFSLEFLESSNISEIFLSMISRFPNKHTKPIRFWVFSIIFYIDLFSARNYRSSRRPLLKVSIVFIVRWARAAAAFKLKIVLNDWILVREPHANEWNDCLELYLNIYVKTWINFYCCLSVEAFTTYLSRLTIRARTSSNYLMSNKFIVHVSDDKFWSESMTRRPCYCE